MNGFLQALSLLTVLPVRVRADDRPAGTAMAYYPLVGALIGLLLAAVMALLQWAGIAASAPLLSAALVLVGWAGVTGGLHLDGLGDCCDALFVPLSRERRLDIMKDPRLGSFGAVGLILLLLLKAATLQTVALSPSMLPALIAVPALGRWAAVVAARGYPSARPGGMGDTFRRGVGRRELAVATATAALAAASLSWQGVLVWLAVCLALLAVAGLARARLGGLTGDVYGAIVEVAETVGLLVVVI